MSRLLAYDTETTGLQLHRGDKMFAWSTCDEKGDAKVYRLDNQSFQNKASKLDLAAFVEDWAAHKIIPIMHEAKFDLTATEKFLGKRIAEDIKFHDTYLQSRILRNNQSSHGLKDLAYVLAEIPKDDEALVKQYVRRQKSDFSAVPEDVMTKYQAGDALRTILLHLFFYPKIKANLQWLDVYQSELQTAVVTMRMEERGIMIDRNVCRTLISQLERQIEEVLDEAATIVGKPVSLSGRELIWLLYQRYNLPILEKTPVTGEPSTEKEVLMKLKEQVGAACPILDLVLKHRSWTHGTAILQSYLDYADEEGVIHPDINPCGAVTGRESCSHPNLQNVAKSRVLLNPFPIPARRVFRPRPGFVNFHIDFSGIEMRLLLHYCLIYSGKDEILWKIVEEDGDLHYPACKIFYPEFDTFDKSTQKTIRTAVKNANFAGAYGAGDTKIAATAGLPDNVAPQRIKVWRDAFPAFVGLSKVLRRLIVQQGFVETVFGRRVFANTQTPYIATNYLVQTTAAEVLKRAKNSVHKYLEVATNGEARILMSIHDELIIEYPRTRLSDSKHIIEELSWRMIDFPNIRIPLKVDTKVATINWEQSSPFDLKKVVIK